MTFSSKSLHLVIESHIHHHHLSSDTDPAGATGVVGVHATPEPHLDTQTFSVRKNHFCSERYASVSGSGSPYSPW